MRHLMVAAVMAGAVALSGCSGKGLRDLRAPGNGPDEFRIEPVKPLVAPDSYASLPAPTPGGANRADAAPAQDAVVALGGKPSSADAGIPATDGALVTAASRHGVDPTVRQSLAETDAQFRKRQSRSTRVRLFPVDRYAQAYQRQALDPFDAAEQFRARGYGTPTYPPEKQ